MIVRKMLQILGRSNWLRFVIRDKIIRFLHNPDTCKSEMFSVSFFRGKYTGNFATFLDWSVFYYGAYAGEELQLFDDFLSPLSNPIFLDIGANVGHHTLFAAMISNKVISFEPFPDVACEIERKISDNSLSNISLFKCALGEKNETAIYIKPSGHNTGTGSFAKPVEKGDDTMKLPIRIGDEILVENEINNVHFIKIDVEGFEPSVLRGLRKTISHCRPIIFFEWTQRGMQSTEENFQNLFPEKYNFYRFIEENVIFGVFRKPTYALLPLSDFFPDGNLLAVPEEYIDHLKTHHSSSNAYNQLYRSET